MIIRIVLFLACISFISPCSANIDGDLDGNGKVELLDIVTSLQISSGEQVTGQLSPQPQSMGRSAWQMPFLTCKDWQEKPYSLHL